MQSIPRRQFLKTGLAASALGFTPFHILKAGPSPNGKLNIACVGVGGMGSHDSNYFAGIENVVALCDVDETRHKRSIADKKNLEGIKLWTDYREMLDQLGDRIDAVYTGTPDHVHFAVSMAAIRRGKHVYTQKPLCHTVNEVRILTEESKKNPVVTQMGHQGHSSGSSAQIRDWVRAGCVGEIREVWAYSRKNYWTKVAPVEGSVCPPTLAWDLFLNRAEAIPFSDSYMKREWIRYSHFSGVTGDMGAHILDAAYYSLDLLTPTSVMAEVAEVPQAGFLPKAGVITWEFPAAGGRPPVTLKYFLGPDIPYPRPKDLEDGDDEAFMNSGSVLIGSEGSIAVGSHSQNGRLLPQKKMKATPKPPEVSYRCKAGNHLQNWVMACKGQDREMSPFSYAGPLSEIIVLGDIAMMHPGKQLLWDAENLRITNDEAADRCLFMKRLAPRDDMNWYL